MKAHLVAAAALLAMPIAAQACDLGPWADKTFMTPQQSPVVWMERLKYMSPAEIIAVDEGIIQSMLHDMEDPRFKPGGVLYQGEVFRSQYLCYNRTVIAKIRAEIAAVKAWQPPSRY